MYFVMWLIKDKCVRKLPLAAVLQVCQVDGWKQGGFGKWYPFLEDNSQTWQDILVIKLS